MADDRRDAPVPSTAINLREPHFPCHNSSTPDSTRSSKSKASSIDGSAPGKGSDQDDLVDTPQDEYAPEDRTVGPRLSRARTDNALGPRPPILQKSQTAPSQTQAGHSFFGMKHATQKKGPRQLARQATLTFDPYSTDSSSSSDDDEPHIHAQADGEGCDRPKTKRKRSNTHGQCSKFHIAHDEFHTKGKISKQDGRLKLSISETVNSGWFAKTLGAGLKRHFHGSGDDDAAKSPIDGRDADVEKISPEDDEMEDPERRVKLNIVIIVIGSRGDIQPFLRIGKILKEDYGHRVRIATHPAFKKFVEEDSKLEFFSVGGDPSELMAFMVKNPGLIPSVGTIKEGEIGRRRAAMYDMFQGMWRACINATDDENNFANLQLMGNKQPFVADAIIANPPSFAPPHIAERLGIPLHMMFTFPYTPTVQFPHPLANIRSSNVDANYTNFMSYPLVEMMTWQGLGDLINRFRTKTLWLDEVSTLWAPGQLYRLKVPYTYMWSPGLVPKPKDWGPEIDISGFVFLDLASSFKPPEDLVKFLDAGEPPVYIGFGSIVVDDPDRFTELIFQAVKMAGVRALVSKGWGGFGGKGNAPENVYMLENTPHDWLFPRVSAVVHHGGAGTTAIGLKCGKPTMIVPFFGDQPFWGGMVSKKKAGAHDCIPYKKLTAERLAEGIKQCLTDEARTNAQEIAQSIAAEGDGALNAVRSFHRSLPLRGESNMRCQILDNHCAAWKLKNTSLRLSPLAAELLVEWKKLKWNDLRLLRVYEWNDFGGPGEPLTGVWGAIVSTMEDVFTGMGTMPFYMAKHVKNREKYYKKKFRNKRREKHARETLARANSEQVNDSGIPNDIAIVNDMHATSTGLKRSESALSHLTVPEDWLAEELVEDAGRGIIKAGAAIIRSPMHIMLALAQGLHNAPRLYGDETVRRPPRITGFHSGLRAGRDEFNYGIYDGVTGIWRQPIHGAKEGGVLGCFRGMGMGIGGLVLKDIAAFVGPPAYLMKGLDEESMKRHQPTNFIRRTRIAQGQKELADLGPGARRRASAGQMNEEGDCATKRKDVEMEVSRTWEAMQADIEAEKKMNKTSIWVIMYGNRNKEGKAVPRKSAPSRAPPHRREPHTNGQLKPKKASSVPIQEAEKLDPPAQGIKSRGTAPKTSLGWKEKARKKNRFEGVSYDEREDAKTESNTKRDVPNSFIANDGPHEVKEEDIPKPEADFDTRPRATSDTIDWATMRQQALDGDDSVPHVR